MKKAISFDNLFCQIWSWKNQKNVESKRLKYEMKDWRTWKKFIYLMFDDNVLDKH